MTAARNSTSQSPPGRPARSFLIGATFLAVTTILAARQETTVAAEKPKETTRPRQVLLDARVVTMEPRYRSQLGTWQKVTLAHDESALSPSSDDGRSRSRSPVRTELLCVNDPASTKILLGKVRSLERSGHLQAIPSPEGAITESQEVLLRTVFGEWFFCAVAQPTEDYYAIDGMELWPTPESAMSITPRAGDGDDIIVETALEVSNRGFGIQRDIPPTIAQRTERHAVTLHTGGTLAWANLIQHSPKDIHPSSLGRLPLVGGLFRNQQAAKRTKETVIFVTAYLIPESPAIVTPAQQ